MPNKDPDIKDPVTAHLAMHIDLINEADNSGSVSLFAFQAEGYLKALYDIGRIQAATVAQYREEIERVSEARLDVLRENRHG